MTERVDLGDGSGRTALADGTILDGYVVSFFRAEERSISYLGEKLGQTVVIEEITLVDAEGYLADQPEILEALCHEGLGHYTSSDTVGEYTYLVREYVAGETIAELLRSGRRFSTGEATQWAINLCQTLTYLHRQEPPIFLGRLEPSNILVHGDTVLLIHLGFAAVDNEPGAPLDEARDVRTDVFALGELLCRLLVDQRYSHSGSSTAEALQRLRRDLPAGLTLAIGRALDAKPSARFASAADFENAIVKSAAPKPEPDVSMEFEAARAGVPSTRPPRRGRRVMATLGLLAVLGAGVTYAQHLAAPPPSEYPASTGVQEASLKGNLFGSGKVDQRSVVFMGEDIGLFEVTPWQQEAPATRAETLATRLNRFYQSACLQCGGSNLESPDIRVGRVKDSGEVVIFYAHIHGSAVPAHGPILLATVDSEQAKALGKSELSVACYWRDIVRDVVDLSRGLPVRNSALGAELTAHLERARKEVKAGDSSVENLRKILGQASGKESLRFRDVFLKVPDRPVSIDAFANVEGFAPLK